FSFCLHARSSAEHSSLSLHDALPIFHPLVEASADVSREETRQARRLGDDPKSGKPIIARYGRYGPMLQRGETESEEKPDFAPMRSEEHTSELQSRENLVCRLLLEKKK